ncbi:ketopantoate reductase family protein [Jiangella rhizosphaerae]|uniref:2-dehydropantoate 2-reductase n=1 Tax=Jiangella rhizosphaerae TaxID=2293569 RepID=A0A418KYJ4_9ACTN|nr:ketopantoate reductase family protein [Jiangella rhizosphaerae]RIQ37833.1 ketopantoate reductase family protein [Jiangella rhizosphaerae]
MAFVIYGAGAIGGVLGARLHSAGFDVRLIARGAHLSAVRAGGLRVESPEGTTTVPVPVYGSPAEAGVEAGDVVILTMKSQDTPAALEALRAVADPSTPVVCVQNGVANERLALRLFSHVYGVCVMFPAAHVEPGVVQARSAPTPGILDIGRYPAGIDDTGRSVAGAFAKAGFVSEPREDIMRWKYRKLVMNLGNAVTALCGADDPDGAAAEVLALVRAEGEAVLAAAGIDVVDEQTDRERRAGILRMPAFEGRAPDGGSSVQSLLRGTGSIEADYLNGEIVLLARLHGVPAPANDLVRQLAVVAARERVAPGSVPASELLERLRA